MGKVDEALEKIQSIEDNTERALQLAGLISTLLKIKGVLPVIIGQTALDCYLNVANGTDQLQLGIHTGKINPRLMQEVFQDQLKGKGMLSEWRICNIDIKVEEEFSSQNRELCRDFTTEYGIVKLVPAEDLTAARIWAAFYPHPNPETMEEAKVLLMYALAGHFVMDWAALENVCVAFKVGEKLERLRNEAQEELTTMQGQEGSAAAEEPAPGADAPPVPNSKKETSKVPAMANPPQE